MPHYPDDIEYSDKYYDDYYEYRHVILPKNVFKKITRGINSPWSKIGKLLSEMEWRSLGVQQSRGWLHYEVHRPEPHILLFRRPKGTDPNTGLPPQGFNPPYWDINSQNPIINVLHMTLRYTLLYHAFFVFSLFEPCGFCLDDEYFSLVLFSATSTGALTGTYSTL